MKDWQTPEVVDWLLGLYPVCKCRRCGSAFCEPTCPEQALCGYCIEKLIDETPGHRNFDEVLACAFDFGCYTCGAAWGDYSVIAWRSEIRPRCTDGHWHSLHASPAELWRVASMILEDAA